jgi:uncharacterized protein (TIGR03083 family)
LNDAWQANIAAWEQTLRSSIALSGELSAEDWTRPTECPGWSVFDQYAHLLGIEQFVAGDVSDGEVRTTANTEKDVAALRALSPAQLISRLIEVRDRRLAKMATDDMSGLMDTPFGRQMPFGDFMSFRAFDCWIHEQDIRRAVGRPGNLDAPAANHAALILGASLPFVVGKRAGAAPGTVVRFVVDGPVPNGWRIAVGDDGRARPADGDEPATVTLSMDWETFIRLAAGRCGKNAVNVGVDGDANLADRILAGMAVTP